jgi:hypothetical protein
MCQEYVCNENKHIFNISDSQAALREVRTNAYNSKLVHSKKRLVIFTNFLPTEFVDFHFPDSTNGFVEFTYQFVHITNLLPISFHFQ